MLRLALVLVLLTLRPRVAHVTHSPSTADRLYQLYEKFEKLTIAPPHVKPERSPHDKLYEKLDKLKSLSPDKVLNDDDEELLAAMQMWGMMTPEQLDGVVRDLQSVKNDLVFAKSDRLPDDDSDPDWNEVEDISEGDYPMDWYNDEQDVSTTSRPGQITPLASTKLSSQFVETVISAVDPIASTKERPRILDDSTLTPLEKIELRASIFKNIANVVKMGKCSLPQPRWYTVRQLAPAANIVYMPPCVQLHRCAADSGCCYDETEVCAPVAGRYVALPFYLQKADGERSMARMLFFNHTQCACVSTETLQTTVRTRADMSKRLHESKETQESRESNERQNDWRAPSTEEGRLERDDGKTPPPQLRRCTCPTLFLARPIGDGVCSCVCEWADEARRRDCEMLARGREHFGMRDRVCVDRGDCNTPACEFGAYDRAAGRCPQRRFRKVRYHRRNSRVHDVQ